MTHLTMSSSVKGMGLVFMEDSGFHFVSGSLINAVFCAEKRLYWEYDRFDSQPTPILLWCNRFWIKVSLYNENRKNWQNVLKKIWRRL